MAKTRPLLTSIAIKAPCTSLTWRRLQRSKLPSASFISRTKTTSPSSSKSPATFASSPNVPSSFFLRAHLTSSRKMKCPSSSSGTSSITMRAAEFPIKVTTAGYHFPSKSMLRGTFTARKAARSAASSPIRSVSIFCPVPRQTPWARS